MSFSIKNILTISMVSLLFVLSGCVSHTIKPNDSYHLESYHSPKDKKKAADIYTQLGQVYFLHQQYKESLKNLLQAEALASNNVQTNTLLGILYNKMGYDQKSETHYRKAQKLLPNSGKTNNNLGAFLCKIGKTKEAKTYLQKAIETPLYETPWVAMTNMGVCQLRTHDFGKAIYYIKQALQIKPDYADALFYMAKILHEKGDDFHAQAFVQKYHEQDYHSQDMKELQQKIEQGVL